MQETEYLRILANTKLNKWYAKMTKYKKPGLVRMAVCRRTFMEVFQMLKKGEYNYYRDEVKHLQKIEDLKEFISGKSEKLLRVA